MIVFFANLLRDSVVSFLVQNVVQDGGHLGKWLNLDGQSKAKLQFRGSHLAV